jgi:DNA-binding protein Fis
MTSASPLSVRRKARGLIRLPPTAGRRTELTCIEAVDSSTHRVSAAFLVRARFSRDESAQAARLADQFVDQNRGLLANLGVTIEPQYDGASVALVIKTGTRIGAIPLLSPTTRKPDYGLVIRPRFDWPGIGPILGATGWRVVPTPLRLPLLPRSERRVPPWVLSTIILSRVKAMLERLERRFELTQDERRAPRGSVDWGAYACRQMPRAQFLNVPCRFPDLRDDRDLKAAIRYALEKQLRGLEGQRSAGMFVVGLIEVCQGLLQRVRDVTAHEPTPSAIQAWARGSLRTEIFRNGLQAVGWTVEDRGLAGLSDLQGLAWAMSMEAFF